MKMFVLLFLILLFYISCFFVKINTDNESKKIKNVEIILIFLLLLLIFIKHNFLLISNFKDTKIFIFVIFIIFISYIDYKKKRIPDFLSFAMILSGIIYSINQNTFEINFRNSLYLSTPILILYLYGDNFFKEEAVGAGDIKFVIGIGFFLNFQSYKIIYLFYLITYIIAVPIAFYIIIFKKNIKTIPFAPFLSIAAICLS